MTIVDCLALVAALHFTLYRTLGTGKAESHSGFLFNQVEDSY